MPSKPIDPFQEEDAQGAVLQRVLRDGREQPWTLGDLNAALPDMDPAAVAASIERLHEHGVVRIDDARITASPSVQHLDGLGYVCI
jgi:hypothetical protein